MEEVVETIKPKRAPRKKKEEGTAVAVSQKKPRKVVAKAPEEAAAVLPILESASGPREYLHSIGRRKQSIAQVRLYRRGTGSIVVNERDCKAYFPHATFVTIVNAPLQTIGQADKVDITAHVVGGGIRGQAEAVRLGIARALIQMNPTFRVSLKRAGFLKRDPRVKERKKYGLKKARRAPQWAKR